MTVQSLIKNECCNYFNSQNDIKHYCCLLDKVCVFFTTDEIKPRCEHAETGVLPLNKDLEFKYKTERRLNTSNMQAACKDCSQVFIRESNKVKYCEKCKAIRKKKQKKSYMQKLRNAV